MLPLAALAVVDVAFMVASKHEPEWWRPMDYLKEDPRFGLVDWIDCTTFTPPLGVMQYYDVIFTGGQRSLHDQDAFGDNLADYVDNGGFVIPILYMLAYESGGVGIGGRWLEYGYSPYKPKEGSYWDWFSGRLLDLTILEPEHPIFQGVSYLNDVEYHVLGELRPGAREIAYFTYPQYPGIAINADDTVVALDYDCQRFDEWTGDGYLIMANAACWLAEQTAVHKMSWGEIKASF